LFLLFGFRRQVHPAFFYGYFLEDRMGEFSSLIFSQARLQQVDRTFRQGFLFFCFNHLRPLFILSTCTGKRPQPNPAAN